MRLFYKILFILLISLPGVCKTSGPNNSYTEIYDFKYEWLIYDSNLKVFIPYISDDNLNLNIHSLKINLDDFAGANLLIKSEKKEGYVFIDNQLKATLKQNQWLVLNIENLKKNSKKNEILLSIHGDNDPNFKKVLIGYPAKLSSAQKENKSQSFLNILPRNISNFNSGLVMFFLLCIALISFLSNNYPKAFKKFYSLRDLGSFEFKESSFLINKPLDRPNIIFVILLSIIIGFLLIITRNQGYNTISNTFILQNGNTFGILFSNFFKLCLIVFTLFILKFFLINLSAKLFNISKIVDIHYFKLIQTTLYFSSLVLVILLVSHNLFIEDSSKFPELTSVILFIFYSFRTLIIYFTIIKKGNIKILYLISYLCIVEILPIIIGLRMISN